MRRHTEETEEDRWGDIKRREKKTNEQRRKGTEGERRTDS